MLWDCVRRADAGVLGAETMRPYRRRFVLLCGMLVVFLTIVFVRFNISSSAAKEIIPGPFGKDRFPVNSARQFLASGTNLTSRLDPAVPEVTQNAGSKYVKEASQILQGTTENFRKAKLRRRKPWPVRDWASTASENNNDDDDDDARKNNGEASNIGKEESPSPSASISESNANSKKTIHSNFSQSKRYFIYICDGKVRCYGFADRQRGIVSAYLLAELTNRTFGVIMTAPAPLQDYYVPNLVNWLIPEEALEGKSSTELSMLGRDQRIDLSTIDFNDNYPEDVVYIRTNRDALHLGIEMNPLYGHNFPKWAHGDWRQQFALGWLRLMVPSTLLRQEINAILFRIAKAMMQEYLIFQQLQKAPCSNVCKYLDLDLEEQQFASQRSAAAALFAQCLSYISEDFRKAPVEYSIRDQDIFSFIESHPFKFLDGEKTEDVAVQMKNLCFVSSAIKPRHSPDEIQAAQHYDFIDLDLVCVHVRMGKNPSMPLEKGIRNSIQETDAIWTFLRPYVKSGRHVFLASDSEQVRQVGKAKFGRRVHVSEAPVVHIDKVNPSDESSGNLGLQLALTEQLVLMTSCRTLVVSESGFSQRAAFVRRSLVDIDELFLFKDGSVVPWPLSY